MYDYSERWFLPSVNETVGCWTLLDLPWQTFCWSSSWTEFLAVAKRQQMFSLDNMTFKPLPMILSCTTLWCTVRFGSCLQDVGCDQEQNNDVKNTEAVSDTCVGVDTSGREAVNVLHPLFNTVLENERMLEEDRSLLVPVSKNKGDVQAVATERWSWWTTKGKELLKQG